MIITSDFIVINFPKTGSTFFREVLFKVYRNDSSFIDRLIRKDNVFEIELPNIRVQNDTYGNMDYHGLRCQIPEKYQSLPVVSIIRNPLERMVSAYKYGFWKDSFPANKESFFETYPDFPNLSFEQYVESRNKFMRTTYFPNVDLPEKIGYMSLQLIQFFTCNPEETVQDLAHNRRTFRQVAKEIKAITFLKTESLNHDVYDLLKQYLPAQKIDFVKNMDRVNTSRNESDTWKNYYTKDFMEYVTQMEAFYFEVFPEYRDLLMV